MVPASADLAIFCEKHEDMFLFCPDRAGGLSAGHAFEKQRKIATPHLIPIYNAVTDCKNATLIFILQQRGLLRTISSAYE